MIINWLRQFRKSNYDTLNRIEINKQAILHNLDLLQAQQSACQLIPVLKSNAYGHGLKELSMILNDSKIKMVAVDSFPEAQIVYRYFKGKVLIIGEMPADAYKYLNWQRTEVCVYNQSILRVLASMNKKIKIHLFVNTGMNREGIKDLEKFLEDNQQEICKLEISGLCSHLHSADTSDLDNEKQLKLFLQYLAILKQKNISVKYIHLTNSAGVFSLHHPSLTACRPGLAVYGINPFLENSKYFKTAEALRPAMEVYTKIVSIQEIKSGEYVAYNRNYIADEDMKVAVIPFGYSEGLDRRLSNLAQFKIAKHYYKIAGSVCMNMSCLAVNNDQALDIGQEVQIISANNKDVNSVVNMARLEGSIAHEFLIKFLANIRRIVVDK